MTAVILAARRTAVVPRGGAFAALEPYQLAAPVIRQLLDDADLAANQVDEVIVSNALGQGGNPARVISLAAGLPEKVAGLSVDRQCAGGMDTVLLAQQMILSGAAEVVIAGGVESYSRRPIRLRTFADGQDPEPYDQAPFTPWLDRDPDMAEAADALGRKLGIHRQAQDEWAVASHAKAMAATDLDCEITPLEKVAKDPFGRKLTAALCNRAKLISGDITAANTAVAADAAAFVILVSEKIANAVGHRGIDVIGGKTVGSDPMLPGLAPVAAIEESLRRANIKLADLSVAEVMEAYAVQAIACVEHAGLDPEIVNPGGGALARGHPIGASGAVNVVRLFHELRQKGGTGLAAIAAAGGLGTALILRA